MITTIISIGFAAGFGVRSMVSLLPEAVDRIHGRRWRQIDRLRAADQGRAIVTLTGDAVGVQAPWTANAPEGERQYRGGIDRALNAAVDDMKDWYDG